MKKRFNAYDKLLSDFSSKIIIHCEKCNKKALAIIKDDAYKITCLSCGYNKSDSETWANFPQKWLEKELSYGVFWAFNYIHLDFLEEHISAELRERKENDMWVNKSLGSRLPKWMTSKKNREDLLKVIKKLRAK